MIIFIFSFGAADPIQRALRWIGLTRHHGDEVLPLYGKMVYTDDLDKTRMQRQLANEFLIFGIVASPMDSVLADIHKKVDREKKGPGENLDNPIQTALQAMDSVRGGMMMFSTPETRHQQIMGSLQRVQMLLDRPEVQKDPEQLRAIDAIATALAVQAWSTNPQKPPQEYYFGGTPKADELLDFALWKHQADKLGIVLTSADICREVNRAWGNGDFLKPDGKFENNDWVGKFLGASQKIHKNLGPQDLLRALTDEYRVAIAKEAILGAGSGVRFYRGAFDGIHHSPAVGTPDEFLKYYQEQRTTLAVSVLPVSVENFVSKVENKPTDEDLRNLFARYKDDEPSPTRRQPGFKEPRRIKVAYFSYRPDSAFGRKQAAQASAVAAVVSIGWTGRHAPRRRRHGLGREPRHPRGHRVRHPRPVRQIPRGKHRSRPQVRQAGRQLLPRPIRSGVRFERPPRRGGASSRGGARPIARRHWHRRHAAGRADRLDGHE